jgi:hypothetical protein
MNDKAFQINNKPVCILFAKIPKFMCNKNDKTYFDFVKIAEFYNMGIHVDMNNHKLSFDITGSFAESEIPKGQYLERNILLSIVHIIK